MKLPDIKETNEVYIYSENNVNSFFRFKLYNSKDEEFIKYNYTENLMIPSGIYIENKNENSIQYKLIIKPNYPQEINGCSNYYFFLLDSKYNLKNKIKSYPDFLNLNSSVFFHNFTAKNVCSINKEFLEKDIDKFYFDFEMKKTEWITICGFSEQVGHFKAIKFVGSNNYYYEK